MLVIIFPCYTFGISYDGKYCYFLGNFNIFRDIIYPTSQLDLYLFQLLLAKKLNVWDSPSFLSMLTYSSSFKIHYICLIDIYSFLSFNEEFSSSLISCVEMIIIHFSSIIIMIYLNEHDLLKCRYSACF